MRAFDDCVDCSAGYACTEVDDSTCHPTSRNCSPDNPSGPCPAPYTCSAGVCVYEASHADCASYEGIVDKTCGALSCDEGTCPPSSSCEDTLEPTTGKVCLPKRSHVGETCDLACEIGSRCIANVCRQTCSGTSDLCANAAESCYQTASGWLCLEATEVPIGGDCTVYHCADGATCSRRSLDGVATCFEACSRSTDACQAHGTTCQSIPEGGRACVPHVLRLGDVCDVADDACGAPTHCTTVSERVGSICVEDCTSSESCTGVGHTCMVMDGTPSCYPPEATVGEACNGMYLCESSSTCLSLEDDGAYVCLEQCSGGTYPCAMPNHTCIHTDAGELCVPLPAVGDPCDQTLTCDEDVARCLAVEGEPQCVERCAGAGEDYPCQIPGATCNGTLCWP